MAKSLLIKTNFFIHNNKAGKVIIVMNLIARLSQETIVMEVREVI